MKLNETKTQDHYMRIKNLLASSLIIILSSCQSTQQSSKQTALPSDNSSKKNWSSEMQSLADTLSELIPYINSAKNFNDPKNQDSIKKHLKKLSGLTHNISDKQISPSNDPSLSLIAAEFNDSISRSINALETGHRDYARSLLKYSTSYCIQCHTKDNMGPSFGTTRINESLAALNPLEKAEFYISTRQFDSALKEIESTLNSPLSKENNIITLDKASRYAMLITIRFQNNPDKAMTIANLIINNESSPYFLKESANKWVTSLKEWQKEPKENTSTPASKVIHAKNLIQKAQKNSLFNSDHSGDVYYLRSSALLHEALNFGLIGEIKSEALYYLGVSYEALRDLNLAELQDSYFEQCIRISPRTNISWKCYKKYEESVFFGFSGSSGLSIPEEVQNKLNELRVLAKPLLIKN